MSRPLSTEPIRAWRIWRVSDEGDLLESPIYGDEWAPGEAFAADCTSHPQPDSGCGCGIYAVTTREIALELLDEGPELASSLRRRYLVDVVEPVAA